MIKNKRRENIKEEENIVKIQMNCIYYMIGPLSLTYLKKFPQEISGRFLN